LVLLKKKVKKKGKTHGRTADGPTVHVTRFPTTDFRPGKVSTRTPPAIPLLRTVVLLA
jgi:hypothetical protein